jgi:hypothetical protein
MTPYTVYNQNMGFFLVNDLEQNRKIRKIKKYV